MFARACAFAGYHIYGEREFHSNIKGLHSYVTITVGVERVRSSREDVHLLASYDAETVASHSWAVRNGGGIIYDPRVVGEKIDSIPTMNERLKEEVLGRLRERGYEATIEGALEEASDRGVKTIPVPYLDLLKKAAEKSEGVKLSNLMVASNVVALTASAAVLRLDKNHVLRSIEEQFGAKRRVLEFNKLVVETVYNPVSEKYGGVIGIELQDQETREERYLLPGYISAALGKLAGGCRFQAYYPITPAQDECFFLESQEVFKLNDGGDGSIIVIQSEDEISAIGMALGAALTGTRAATATSGPGFSLMTEMLGWAGMSEVPIVITLYQRGGPSTGLPTRHEQGDLLFALFGGHGEFPRIVLSSGDVEEAFYDAVLAQNLAERYQLPVIHLLDKAIANMLSTLPAPDLEKLRIERGIYEEDGGEYRRYRITGSGVSPLSTLGGGEIFWATGNEHDEYGHVTEDPVLRERMMEKRMRKLELASKEIPSDIKVKRYGGGRIGIVSWGSTKGPILDAMEELGERGLELSFLQVKLIRPFPKEEVKEFARSVERLIFVEQNYSGQLAKLASMEAGVSADHLILKFNGRPFSYQELVRDISQVLEKNVRRLVSSRRWEV